MEDIFYFTRSHVSLKNIEDICQPVAHGFQHGDDGIGPLLNVFFEATKFWQFIPVDPEKDLDLEPDALETVKAYQPVVSYMISYHPYSLPDLTKVMKLVLEKYGGWVGCDDYWTKTYTVDDILTIDCSRHDA